MPSFTESLVESAALSWLADLGYATLPGRELAPGEWRGDSALGAERPRRGESTLCVQDVAMVERSGRHADWVGEFLGKHGMDCAV